MTYRPLAAALCLAGLALAGCGGSQPAIPQGISLPAAPGSGGSAPADGSLAGLSACALVPTSTLHQVYGALVRPCVSSSTFGDIELASASDPNDTRADVTITIMKRSGFEAARAFAQGASDAGASKITSVPGVGDAAFAITKASSDPDYDLWAARGGLALNIDVNSSDPSDAQAVRQLMTAALTRL